MEMAESASRQTSIEAVAYARAEERVDENAGPFVNSSSKRDPQDANATKLKNEKETKSEKKTPPAPRKPDISEGAGKGMGTLHQLGNPTGQKKKAQTEANRNRRRGKNCSKER